MGKQRGSWRGISLVELAVYGLVTAGMVWFAAARLETPVREARSRDLAAAADAGDYGYVNWLLRRGASPDGYSGETPHYCLLCSAVERGELETVSLIFSGSPEQAARYRDHANRKSLLAAATWAGHPEVAAELLRHGVAIDVAKRMDYAVLRAAVNRLEWATVEALGLPEPVAGLHKDAPPG